MSTPDSASSLPSCSVTSRKSQIPVDGTCSAAIARTCGSWWASSATVSSLTSTPLRRTAAGELCHARQLVGRRGDDHLAAHLVRQVVATAERDRLAIALHGELRLEAAGRVVEPGMDDVGVVAGLVGGERGFLLDHGDPARRIGAAQCEGGGQPDDPTTDDDDVVARGAAVHTPIIGCGRRPMCDRATRRARRAAAPGSRGSPGRARSRTGGARRAGPRSRHPRRSR